MKQQTKGGTEVDQITDFGPGIINQLASSALKDTITEISSDSLLSKMVGLVLQASGVKYLTGQNGYLFFGNFMGNIGIQWINRTDQLSGNAMVTEYLPLTTAKNFIAILSDTDTDSGNTDTSGGSSIKYIDEKSVLWAYNWNNSEKQMINVLVIGKL